VKSASKLPWEIRTWITFLGSAAERGGDLVFNVHESFKLNGDSVNVNTRLYHD